MYAKKPKNARAKRAMEARAPKLVENTKTAMFIRGSKTSNEVTSCLRDLCSIQKPHGLMLGKRNPILPFEDDSKIEFLSNKNDASLFVLGTHSKKRPHNLVMGRLFNYHVLDMFEFGITNYLPVTNFKNKKSAVGSKPLMVFQGELFELNDDLAKVKNVLIDFFRGTVAERIHLSGLDHIIAVTALSETQLAFRHYRIDLKKSGSKLPRVELDEIGPSFDMTMRRTRWAAEDAAKQARRQPKRATAKKYKNVSHDIFNQRRGRIHMERQDMNEIALKKMKGLKKVKRKRAEGADSGGGGEGRANGGRGLKTSGSKRARTE